MSARLFYDRTRPTAPWCVLLDDPAIRPAYFQVRWRAAEVARSWGWNPPVREQLIDLFDEWGVDDDSLADEILKRFDVTEKTA